MSFSERALVELLTELFSREELMALLYHNSQRDSEYSEVLKHVPYNSSLFEFSQVVVSELRKRRLIDEEFFASIKEDRPTRVDLISDVEAVSAQKNQISINIAPIDRNYNFFSRLILNLLPLLAVSSSLLLSVSNFEFSEDQGILDVVLSFISSTQFLIFILTIASVLVVVAIFVWLIYRRRTRNHFKELAKERLLNAYIDGLNSTNLNPSANQ